MLIEGGGLGLKEMGSKLLRTRLVTDHLQSLLTDFYGPHHLALGMLPE